MYFRLLTPLKVWFECIEAHGKIFIIPIDKFKGFAFTATDIQKCFSASGDMPPGSV
jgi:hypothetical protein